MRLEFLEFLSVTESNSKGIYGCQPQQLWSPNMFAAVFHNNAAMSLPNHCLEYSHISAPSVSTARMSGP